MASRRTATGKSPPQRNMKPQNQEAAMPHNSFFFDDDMEAAERQRRRGNPLLGPAFQAAASQLFPTTPLDVAMGEASPERVAEAARAQREALEGRRLLLPPQGPVTLTLGGEVLDGNIITSTRALDSLRDNPNVPQLVNDRMMVASPQGVVRIIPEPGEDPAMVERFKASSLLPGAPAPKPRATAAPVAAPATRVSVAPRSVPFVTRASFAGATSGTARTRPPTAEELERGVRDAQDREAVARGERAQANLNAEIEARRRADAAKIPLPRRNPKRVDPNIPPSLLDASGNPIVSFEGDLVFEAPGRGRGSFVRTPDGNFIPLNGDHIALVDPRDGRRKVFLRNDSIEGKRRKVQRALDRDNIEIGEGLQRALNEAQTRAAQGGPSLRVPIASDARDVEAQERELGRLVLLPEGDFVQDGQGNLIPIQPGDNIRHDPVAGQFRVFRGPGRATRRVDQLEPPPPNSSEARSSAFGRVLIAMQREAEKALSEGGQLGLPPDVISFFRDIGLFRRSNPNLFDLAVSPITMSAEFVSRFGAAGIDLALRVEDALERGSAEGLGQILREIGVSKNTAKGIAREIKGALEVPIGPQRVRVPDTFKESKVKKEQ